MMDVRGCHLRIASVKMIDPSPRRGRLKFTAPERNLHRALASSQIFRPPTTVTSAADVRSSLCGGGRARVQLARRAELMV